MKTLSAEQAFQTAVILAAISVPVLAAVSAVDVLATNVTVVRSIAISGFLFLIAALFAFFEIIEIRDVPQVTVSEAFRGIASSQGALLAGLITLLVFQISQARTVF